MTSNLDFKTILEDNNANRLFSDVNTPSPYELHNIDPKFWETDDLCKYISSNLQEIILLHSNIQSLEAKYDSFITFLTSLISNNNHCLPSVIALSETWLNSTNESLFPINGYQPLIARCRLDHSNRGGVGLFVRDDLEIIPRPDLEKFIPFVFESVFITLKTLNITIGVIYSTPDSDKSKFLDYYGQLIDQLQMKSESFFILGDFNIDIFKYGRDSNSNDFINKTLGKGCIPLITKPTRVTPTSSTCIDNIITNLSCSRESGPIHEHISDHFPVFCSLSIDQPKRNKQAVTNTLFRDFSESNMQKLNANLSNMDWSSVTSDADPSSACCTLHTLISKEIEKTCPLSTRKSRKNNIPTQPWFTPGLKVSRKRKQRLFKKSFKNPEQLVFYRKYRNLYNLLIKRAKSRYYSERLQKSSHDIKGTWAILREVISKTKTKVTPPNYLTVVNENNFSTLLENNEIIAEHFNNYFATVGLRTSESISDLHTCDPLDFMSSISVIDSLFLSPTSIQEIINISMSIKSKSSTGYDNLSNKLVKSIITNIAKPLEHIFNQSLLTGKFPDNFKIAKVIPIFKSGDQHDPNNYRPISLLPALSKILEKLIHKRITDFILKQNILYPQQYGFLKGRTTEQAMLDILMKITDAIEKKEYAFGIFLDLSKAFDSLSHNILLNKLNFYGIRGISNQLLKSYLTNRQQFVMINNTASAFQPVTCGVPQGSVLGPLLFLLYINDMPFISRFINYILFADDTTGLYKSPSLDEAYSTIQKELDMLSTWFSSNKLLINITKTNYILFTTRQREQFIPNEESHKLTLSSTDIIKKNVVKFLGLHLDKNVSFKLTSK